jgi:long-chain fatty acid transport protein
VVTWRAGYVYHDSPVPNATLNPYVDGVLEHAFSLGVSRFYDDAVLNLAYEYAFGNERHVGDSALVGDDFSNSTFDADAHWIAVSLLVPY